jgi:N-formylglutamate amidohydrolase
MVESTSFLMSRCAAAARPRPMHTRSSWRTLWRNTSNAVLARNRMWWLLDSAASTSMRIASTEAYDSPAAKPAYDAYHNRIRLFIAQLNEGFPRGALLLDIHGQSGDPGVVHRGTQNGSTVAALVRRHGSSALVGSDSIFGVLSRHGYKVFPPNTPIGNPPEDRRFNGGYTVRAYSSEPYGIDAIQIEVGRTLRTDATFIAALGEGIVAFYRTYLQASP